MEFFGYLFVIVVWMMANPIAGIIIYLLPVFFALLLQKRSAFPIIILTILLGWFFPAWIIFLLWSVFGEKKLQNGLNDTVNMHERACQFCSHFFPEEQTRCPKCGKEQRTIDV